MKRPASGIVSRQIDRLAPRSTTAILLRCLVAFLAGLTLGASPGEAEHWAFRKPERCAPPAVSAASWIRNPIDSFVLLRLDEAGLKPAPEASRATLIRRLSLDLRGIPPTEFETRQFLSDTRPGAYDRLIETMLSSPLFGERWGRHWLDLARYADSNGYTRDFGRSIWRYRDWVIRAWNEDRPFDRFTLEQLAGDLLPGATLDQMIATGFHRNTLINEEGGTDQEQFRVDSVADRVATTGVVFLGMTFGCARCHDHKFDPVTQREYYQLFAFLNSCDEPTIDAPLPHQIAAGTLEVRQKIREEIARLEERLNQKKDLLLASQLDWEERLTPEEKMRLPGPTQEALQTKPSERTDAHKEATEQLYRDSDEAREKFPVVAEIHRLRSTEPLVPTTMVMKERTEPRQTHVHIRGNFLDKGEPVLPQVPRILHPLRANLASPDRVDLAHWLTDSANPLTARVTMNRYWQRLFGVGLVVTENDFGVQGDPPSHPLLLDWLALEFQRQNWSMKAMVRIIVQSATYRQSSAFRPDLREVDPKNRLLSRQNRTRLDAEIIRDAALQASSSLTVRLGGPSVFPPQPDGVFDFTQDPKPWKTSQGSERFRRGMYTHFWRSSPYPSLMVFDFPNSNVTCTRRVRSNTPLQALTLANDTTFIECARNMSQVIVRRQLSVEEGLRAAYQSCFSRDPKEAELRTLIRFYQRQRAEFDGDREAAAAFAGSNVADAVVERAVWTAVARVLLNLDEFVTRE